VKNVFLALLLANLLFLGWTLWIAPPAVDPMRLRAPGDEPTVAAVPGPPKPQAATPAAGEAGCTRLGPIGDGQVADALRSRLAGLGVASTMTTAEGQVWVGHWVQIESVASRAEADRAVARLAAGGLPDAYVLQTSPPFSISLGVFRDRGKAEAVSSAAAALGFRPQVTDRYRAGIQYWLTFSQPAEGKLPLEDFAREFGQILRTERVACPAAPIGSVGAFQ
jgi:hypothetical protein